MIIVDSFDWKDGDEPPKVALVIVLLGILAGILTTLAGLGGGMFLVLTLSLTTGPVTALAATAPALFVGNLHRALTYRRETERAVARRLILGVLPGSLIGGLLAAQVPEGLLTVVLIGTTSLALLKRVFKVEVPPLKRALTPTGFGLGFLCATSGGAGLLTGPILMAQGLSGTAYVATSATIGVAMHLGRVVAYGASGLFDGETRQMAAVFAVSILVGNWLGGKVRPFLSPNASANIELGALLACAALAIVGVH